MIRNWIRRMKIRWAEALLGPTDKIYWAEDILGLSPADIDFIVEHRRPHR